MHMMHSFLVLCVAAAVVAAAAPLSAHATLDAAASDMEHVTYPTHRTLRKGNDEWLERVPDNERLAHMLSWARETSTRMAGVAKTPAEKRWCPKDQYWEFMPAHLGDSLASRELSLSGACFGKSKASLDVHADGFTLTIEAAGAVQPLCSDFLMIANREHIYFTEVAWEGTHRVHNTKWANAFEQADVAKNGLRIIQMPCNVVGTAVSLLRTLKLFDAKGMAQVDVNRDFLEYKMGWKAVPYNKQVHVPAELIRSGDYLAVMRYDGMDPMIAYGTGGQTGHSTVALWNEEHTQLYVLESTDAPPGMSYWPPPYGIIHTPYEQWVSQAANAQFDVAVLPLAPELSAKFDEKAAWALFHEMEGMPYGYHNFIMSFMDTAMPLQDLPMPLDDEVVDLLFNEASRLIKPTTDDGKVSLYNLVIQAMNHRLHTTCKDFHCLNAAMDKAGYKYLTELMAIPENDDWIYSGGNYSRVCSAFASNVWKAGLHWGEEFQSTEQTPKDNYQLAIYDPAHFNADNCPGGLMTTPNGTFCQILGHFELTLPGYNSIAKYDHINEKCACYWPTYERLPKGC